MDLKNIVVKNKDDSFTITQIYPGVSKWEITNDKTVDFTTETSGIDMILLNDPSPKDSNSKVQIHKIRIPSELKDKKVGFSGLMSKFSLIDNYSGEKREILVEGETLFVNFDFLDRKTFSFPFNWFAYDNEIGDVLYKMPPMKNQMSSYHNDYSFELKYGESLVNLTPVTFWQINIDFLKNNRSKQKNKSDSADFYISKEPLLIPFYGCYKASEIPILFEIIQIGDLTFRVLRVNTIQFSKLHFDEIIKIIQEHKHIVTKSHHLYIKSGTELCIPNGSTQQCDNKTESLDFFLLSGNVGTFEDKVLIYETSSLQSLIDKYDYHHDTEIDIYHFFNKKSQFKHTYYASMFKNFAVYTPIFMENTKIEYLKTEILDISSTSDLELVELKLNNYETVIDFGKETIPLSPNQQTIPDVKYLNFEFEFVKLNKNVVNLKDEDFFKLVPFGNSSFICINAQIKKEKTTIKTNGLTLTNNVFVFNILDDIPEEDRNRILSSDNLFLKLRKQIGDQFNFVEKYTVESSVGVKHHLFSFKETNAFEIPKTLAPNVSNVYFFKSYLNPGSGVADLSSLVIESFETTYPKKEGLFYQENEVSNLLTRKSTIPKSSYRDFYSFFGTLIFFEYKDTESSKTRSFLDRIFSNFSRIYVITSKSDNFTLVIDKFEEPFVNFISKRPGEDIIYPFPHKLYEFDSRKHELYLKYTTETPSIMITDIGHSAANNTDNWEKIEKIQQKFQFVQNINK